jgi:hypothetical protein
VSKDERNPSETTDTKSNKRSRRNNGINYLENTPEAETPPDYYLIKESGDPNAIQKRDNASANANARASSNGTAEGMFKILTI